MGRAAARLRDAEAGPAGVAGGAECAARQAVRQVATARSLLLHCRDPAHLDRQVLEGEAARAIQRAKRLAYCRSMMKRRISSSRLSGELTILQPMRLARSPLASLTRVT